MTPVVVLTTVGTSFDARTLGRELVAAHVAACVNIIERIASVYRWQGKIEEEGEQLLIIKTTRERLDDLRTLLFKRHPYEVPEFVVVPVEVEGLYREWLGESVEPGHSER